MTLRDLFTDKTLWEKYGDMDVYNDVYDDMAPCWCGTLLTESGQMHFDNVLDTYETLLDTEIEINESRYGYDINVKLNDYMDYPARWRATKNLFSCAAGYCGCDEYDEWFYDDCDDEEPKSEPETNAGYDILQKLSSSGSGYEEGYVLGFKKGTYGCEWVTWGYHKRPDEEPSYYWGHYFRDKEAAQKDLLERMSGMLKNLEAMR